MEETRSFCEAIKETCQSVVNQSVSVQISDSAIDNFITEYKDLFGSLPQWENDHIDPLSLTLEQLISYVAVIDAVNFCFWPFEGELEYGNIIGNLNTKLKQDPSFFSAIGLKKAIIGDIAYIFGNNEDFPLIDERLRSVRELGATVCDKFNGSFEELLVSCDWDCEKLAAWLGRNVSTFGDTSLYKGRQVFFYKRAQIMAADLFCAMNKKGFEVKNIEKLTMFPDYRVPQILNEAGVLVYSKELAEKIEKKEEIKAHSMEEVEIRAGTVVAVERMKEKLNGLNAIQVDHVLWNLGEKRRAEIVNHHRTLTVFY